MAGLREGDTSWAKNCGLSSLCCPNSGCPMAGLREGVRVGDTSWANNWGLSSLCCLNSTGSPTAEFREGVRAVGLTIAV